MKNNKIVLCSIISLIMIMCQTVILSYLFPFFAYINPYLYKDFYLLIFYSCGEENDFPKATDLFLSLTVDFYLFLQVCEKVCYLWKVKFLEFLQVKLPYKVNLFLVFFAMSLLILLSIFKLFFSTHLLKPMTNFHFKPYYIYFR